MKIRNEIVLAVVLCFCAVVFFSACGGNDLPPDDGTPEPPALNGVYSSEYGTLTFDGDGKTILLNLTDKFAKKSELPSGETGGIYVFLFHNGRWRYDKAETFCITIGDERYSFQNATHVTDQNTVAFILDGETVKFERER